MTITTTATQTCPACSGAVEPSDRFCPSCGTPVAPPVSAAPPIARSPSPSASHVPPPPSPGLADLLAKHPERIASASLLVSAHPFCRACGTDHDAVDRQCPTCGSSTAPLPPGVDGTLGQVYTFRRKLVRRRAVRIGDEGSAAKLLFESGEESTVETAELSEPVPSLVPAEVARPLRTPQGALLQLSAAVRSGAVKSRWDPDALAAAAVGHVRDQTSARLVALDAMALNWIAVVGTLPMHEAERNWLRALHASAIADVGAAITAIAALPAAGYRAKLGLIARVASVARSSGVDIEPIEPHLAAFRDGEPVAAMLHRALGFSSAAAAPGGDVPAETARATRRLAVCPGVPADLSAELVAGLDTLAGETADVDMAIRLLPRNSRLLLAATHSHRGLIGTRDVDAIPTSQLDDLIEAGAVDRDVVVSGCTDLERTRYFRARVAPATLSDEDVDRLSHVDEVIRRAFRRNDADVLAAVPDSAMVRHYRALLSLRGRHSDPRLIEDVRPGARPVVERLLALSTAKAERADLSRLLDEELVKDATVWPVVVEIAGSTGLSPTAELVHRFPAFTEWLSLHQAREHLFRGEWRGAVVAADRCLALARDEAVRDEALNLKACGLHHLGDDAGAVAALEEAIEGTHSEALLANVGVVAAGLKPEIAARYLGMLMREAPTVAMRVAAARRAVAIWSTSDTASWRNSDASPLPDAFQEPLHELVVAPIGLDDFRDFAALLAAQDSEWFANEANLAASPHRSTLEARLYAARARDLHEMVAVMGGAMAGGYTPQWVIDERDSLRSAALDILFENLDEPDNTFGSVALTMLDNDVLEGEVDRLLFTGLGVASVTYHLSMRQTEVADKIVERLLKLRNGWQSLAGDDRERIEPVVELATRRVALNRMSARDRELSQAIDAYNGAIDIGRRAEYGSPAYFEANRRIRAALDVATTARNDLYPLMPLVDHAEVRDDINKTIETTRELEARCLRVLS